MQGSSLVGVFVITVQKVGVSDLSNEQPSLSGDETGPNIMTIDSYTPLGFRLSSLSPSKTDISNRTLENAELSDCEHGIPISLRACDSAAFFRARRSTHSQWSDARSRQNELKNDMYCSWRLS